MSAITNLDELCRLRAGALAADAWLLETRASWSVSAGRWEREDDCEPIEDAGNMTYWWAQECDMVAGALAAIRAARGDEAAGDRP